MKANAAVHPIRTYGADLRFLCGRSPEDQDQSDALAINPLAPDDVLISAARDRIEKIKDISAVFGYMTDDCVDSMPAHVLTGVMATLHSLANEVSQLMEFVNKAKRGAA